MPPGRLDYVGCDQEIIAKEINRRGAVRENAPHACCREENELWPFALEKPIHCGGIAQIQFRTGADDDVAISFFFQLTNDSRPHQTSVPSDKYSRRKIHACSKLIGSDSSPRNVILRRHVSSPDSN